MGRGKKLNSLEDLGGLVYSTNSDMDLPSNEESEDLANNRQYLEAHFEKKGRGGKTAVLIKGFEGSDDALKELSKRLKNHCAVGGSVKEGDIILQGNVRDKAMSFLQKEGYNVKRVGG